MILKRRNNTIQRKKRNDPHQTYRWHKFSEDYRKKNPLCVLCLNKGITKVAKCVDHIQPISKRGLMWDTSNLQSLCLSCHSKKTIMDNTTQICKINLVWGPPCSGKSTIIEQRKKDNDIVLDMDALSKTLLGSSTKDSRIRNKETIKLLINIRNAILKSLLNQNVTIWIPSTYTNGIFTSLSYNLIENIISKEECLIRLSKSDRQNKHLQELAINEWFGKNPNIGINTTKHENINS